MKRLDELIEKVRRYTGTQSYTDAASLNSQIGLQTQTLVDLFNEAVHTLHGLLYSNASAVYLTSSTQDITAGTEAYTIPSDAFLDLNIVSVEYKLGGDSNDYVKLERRDIHMRDTSSNGTPSFYVQQGNQILLNPIPATSITNGLRLTYEARKPDVDVRRGKVSAVDSGSNPTSITITNTTHADIAFAASAAPEKITVVDSNGNIQMKNITVSSYSSGVLTVSASPSSGEAVAVNDYVVIGDHASSHPDFPDFMEHFLTEYVKHAIYDMLGHPSVNVSAQKLQQIGAQIADVWSDHNADIMKIQLFDSDRIIEDL